MVRATLGARAVAARTAGRARGSGGNGGGGPSRYMQSQLIKKTLETQQCRCGQFRQEHGRDALRCACGKSAENRRYCRRGALWCRSWASSTKGAASGGRGAGHGCGPNIEAAPDDRRNLQVAEAPSLGRRTRRTEMQAVVMSLPNVRGDSARRTRRASRRQGQGDPSPEALAHLWIETVPDGAEETAGFRPLCKALHKGRRGSPLNRTKNQKQPISLALTRSQQAMTNQHRIR